MSRKGSSRKESLDCRQVKALLGAFLENGLPPQQEAAVRTHLEGCSDCRREADQEAILASRLRLEAAGRHRRLSPEAAVRIQERVCRRIQTMGVDGIASNRPDLFAELEAEQVL
jgi:predicted anti-sigma-YlaC factor YlaD